MNRHVNAIAGRLSLRPPQRHSLEILDRITEIAPPQKEIDADGALAAIRSKFLTVTDFEREFPSLCFALATGVGKTRLMGAFISYLHLAHGINNFFVLAPNLTIYNKLIADFTPGTPKYVFKGIAEFATELPDVITGDTYESGIAVHRGVLPGIQSGVRINIFNISKINSEVRGGKSPRIKRLSEYLGESYFDYLAGLPDFVAETADTIYMLEPKAKNQMEDADVLAKRDAAVRWCQQASAHAATFDMLTGGRVLLGFGAFISPFAEFW